MTARAIPAATDEPLSALALKFVDAYVHLRDIKEASKEVGILLGEGRKLWADPKVKAEIDRRMESVAKETDKLIAKKRVVNVEQLDQHLMQVVTLPRKSLKESPTLAASKVKAIELGYQRVGLLYDNNFVPDAASAPTAEEAPRIFRATERTILTHQVVTHQQVTTREVSAPVPIPEEKNYAY